jgi:glycosyltransferase involved in cell wall biosynthesis
VVIRAIGILRDRFPDLVCLLIGDTSPDDSAYRVQILQQIADAGLAGRVLVTGFRPDVANYIAASEILVHASVNPEPFGRVLLEGMALHKPLVASNGGAVPEIVVDGETGLLFTPGDPESLAGRLQELLEDSARLERMGQAGYLRMSGEFTIAQNPHDPGAVRQGAGVLVSKVTRTVARRIRRTRAPGPSGTRRLRSGKGRPPAPRLRAATG